MIDIILLTPFNEGKNGILDGSSDDSATVGQLKILTFTHQWITKLIIDVNKVYSVISIVMLKVMECVFRVFKHILIVCSYITLRLESLVLNVNALFYSS